MSNYEAAGCYALLIPKSTGNYSNITPHCINHCVCTVQNLRSSMLSMQHFHAVQKYPIDCLDKLLIHNLIL